MTASAPAPETGLPLRQPLTPSGRLPGRLGAQERAVLSVLLDCSGRVVSRHELARRAGLSGLHERRCDSVLVALRRALGDRAIRTVRGRGWMLLPEFADAAATTLDT